MTARRTPPMAPAPPMPAGAPPHPDAQLLADCADALHAFGAIDRTRHETPEALRCTAPERRGEALRAQLDYEDLQTERARILLRRIGKLPARTGAGIYAKALCVRRSRTGAAVLAKSLADDLIANPALRALLWPPAPPVGGA